MTAPAPAAAAAPVGDRPLTRHEQALLAFADRTCGRVVGHAFDAALRASLDLGPIGFIQQMGAVVWLPAAEEFRPALVRRWRRAHEQHAAARAPRHPR